MRLSEILMSLTVGLILLGPSSAQEKKDPKAPEKLDGKWYTVKQEQFGGAVPAIVAKRLSIVIDGDKMEWYIGNPAPNMAATFTLDPDKKTIDAKVTRGSLNGKTMVGIYKIEDGKLHICWAEIEAKRPEKFATTKPGGGVFEYSVYSREQVKDNSADPPKIGTPGKKDPAPKLADLKFSPAKGWEIKFRDGSNTWEISHGGFAPSIIVGWAPAKDQPKDLDEYSAKLQKGGDHFGYGVIWDSVTEKGKWADGLFVVGKVKLKDDKVAKRIGFSIVRDLGGEKVFFESFSTDYDDAKLLKEAMEICKSAKFSK